MPEIGDALQRARRDRGVAIGEVEEATKIRGRYLRALEEERWETLPGDAYARGFLATYARYLGLDPERLLDAYRKDVARPPAEAVEQAPREPLPAPATTSGRRWAVAGGAALAIVAILAVVGLLAGGGGSPPAKDRSAAASTPKRHASKRHRAAKATTGNRVQVSVNATAPVWVCMVDQDGKPLIDAQTLSAGDEQGPYESRRFELNVGNGAIELDVDGRPVETPSSSSPLGFRISSKGVHGLASGSRPTCA